MKYTKKYAKELCESNPNKNNLYGLSSLLDKYQVDNEGLLLDRSKSSLSKIDPPFVVEMKDGFGIVLEKDTEIIDLLISKKKKTISYDEFIENWSGVVLISELNEKSGEPNYSENRKASFLEIFEKCLLGALLFFVFAGLLEKGIYTSRIFHILNEWKMRLITRIPLLHMNRLYLLWGMLTIKPFLKDTDFIQYVDQIKRSVDVKYLIEREINIKNIFVTNGYSLLFVLLKLIDKKYPLYSFVYDENQIVDKIKTSPAWKDLQDVPSFYRIHRGLLNGFLGVDLLLFSNEMLDK